MIYTTQPYSLRMRLTRHGFAQMLCKTLPIMLKPTTLHLVASPIMQLASSKTCWQTLLTLIPSTLR
jgi:hypothetical protein